MTSTRQNNRLMGVRFAGFECDLVNGVLSDGYGTVRLQRECKLSPWLFGGDRLVRVPHWSLLLRAFPIGRACIGSQLARCKPPQSKPWPLLGEPPFGLVGSVETGLE